MTSLFSCHYSRRKFLQSKNPDIPTQNIESMWSQAEKMFRQMHGTSRGLFDTYLVEFMGCDEPFLTILCYIAQQYPLYVLHITATFMATHLKYIIWQDRCVPLYHTVCIYMYYSRAHTHTHMMHAHAHTHTMAFEFMSRIFQNVYLS